MKARLAITMLSSVLCASASQGAVRYAKTSGSGDCSSWANACSLSNALSSAVAGDQVWVKSGTYTGSFTVPNAVKVIGGFGGTETAVSQSNPNQYVTALDGLTNARVVSIENASSTTMLRGVTIRNGNDTSFDGGGGMMISNSSPLIVDCIFQDNDANYFGGGVAITGTSSPQFMNCVFRYNGSGSGTSVTPLGGGAVFLHEGTPIFTNCLFYGNVAGDAGAILIQDGISTFLNCTVADNDATYGAGGGLFDQLATAVVKNSIFWGNSAVRGGNQIYNDSSSSTTVTYSDVEGGWTGTGNINSDPVFVNASGGDYLIAPTSPCRNTGSNTLLPADVGDLDWDGNTTETLSKDLTPRGRIIQLTVDMGAYEALIPIEE